MSHPLAVEAAEEAVEEEEEEITEETIIVEAEVVAEAAHRLKTLNRVNLIRETGQRSLSQPACPKREW